MTPRSPIDRIYLIGLMGAGKSTLGRLLSESMHWQFTDLDEQIEEAWGFSVTKIFNDHGEAAFRDAESKVLQATLNQKQVVVACGGGIILRSENHDLLKTGLVIWLELNPHEAASRIRLSKQRPLLNENTDTATTLANILDERKELYEKVAEIRLNCSGSSPDELVRQILNKVESSYEHA